MFNDFRNIERIVLDHRNLSLIDVRQDLMQSLANGIYEATYHIYAGIWIITNTNTRILLLSNNAETNVQIREEMKIIEHILRLGSAIF